MRPKQDEPILPTEQVARHPAVWGLSHLTPAVTDLQHSPRGVQGGDQE